MYCSAFSLLVALGLAVAGPVVHDVKTSQVVHLATHVPIKAVRSYLNKTKLGARGLVNDFQDVLQTNPKGADIDHHRHTAKGYLPKAIQTIVAMRESADSMLRQIDENGLEPPQMMGGKQDCHQLKKSIDAIKEVAVENLCSKLKRQEIIAYFKSDLNCLLGSIFELWRASERDGSYLTLGYRDIIQTIKNLLVAIETGIRRFSEEINYMDFSNECQKYHHMENSGTPVVHVPVPPKTHVETKPSGEGKDKAKDEGKGVHANTVVVGGVVHSGKSSLVEKVEKVIKLEQKELDDIKAAAEKELKKVGGAGKNSTIGEVGKPVVQKTDEKKDVDNKVEKDGEGEESNEESEEKMQKDEEKKTKKVDTKVEEKGNNVNKEMVKEEKAEEKEKVDDKNVVADDKKKEEEEEVKEEEKVKKEEEKVEEKKVKESKPEKKVETKIVTGNILPVAADNNTSVNETSGMVDDVDKNLVVVLKKEENDLKAVLNELEKANKTSEGETEDLDIEMEKLATMLEDLDKVMDEVEAIDAMKKNKSDEVQKRNLTIIDVITKSPVITDKMTPLILIKNESAVAPSKGPIVLTTEKSKLLPKVPTTPQTNLNDVENEEKSLEILRDMGHDVFHADEFKPKTSNDKPSKEAVIPAKNGTLDLDDDIDNEEERDQEEKAKKMVEEAEEEKEKEEDEKESKKEEKKGESPVEKKPVEKKVETPKIPAPVPDAPINSTMDGIISRINDEEAEVRNLIKTLNG